MSFLATGKVNYPARIKRAELLSARHPFAAKILDFYAHVARFQKDFYEQLPKHWGKQPIAPPDGDLRTELNLPVVLNSFGAFLSLIESNAPGPLAARARQLRMQGETRCAQLLTEYWKAGLLESSSVDQLDEFLARAFFQPYGEFIVAAMLPPVLPMTVCRCPRCNALPLLGVLRPEGDGGKRFLQCAFCSQEWEFRRILCAHCGEEKESQLPVYVAEAFPHIRVECCDTCKRYLRTIDLTRDGNAIPMVDDLAAIPLRLWADENGYERIQDNLLGT